MPACSNPDCAHPDTACALRVAPGEVCPHLGRDPHAAAAAVISPAPARATPGPTADRRFWSGDALPSNEAGRLFLARNPRFLLVAGLPNAGKSCLLASQYLSIGSGRPRDFGWRFCHSRTLRGWEHLGDASLRWSGSLADPIVPRTPRHSPYLLHVAFKARVNPYSLTVSERVSDVVLTDLPGEIFADWAEARDRSGDLPISRVDQFWVVVDLPAALGNRGERSRVIALLDRVVEAASEPSRHARPIALLLTKTDLVENVPDSPGDTSAWGERTSNVERLLAPLRRHSGAHAVFAVSAFREADSRAPGDAVLAPMAWSLSQLTHAPLPDEPRVGERYFSRFRESSPVCE
jgi:hypothetical protein